MQWRKYYSKKTKTYKVKSKRKKSKEKIVNLQKDSNALNQYKKRDKLVFSSVPEYMSDYQPQKIKRNQFYQIYWYYN